MRPGDLQPSLPSGQTMGTSRRLGKDITTLHHNQIAQSQTNLQAAHTLQFGLTKKVFKEDLKRQPLMQQQKQGSTV